MNIPTGFNSIIELIQSFPDEQTCIEHLEKIRWNGNVVSPFDPESKVYVCKDNRYRCRNTGKYFNVKHGTMFDNTKIELQKWFLAIWLVLTHKKGISSMQLSRDLQITQKTSWFMLQRIRACFGLNKKGELENEVEVDETFVGGKEGNKKKSQKRGWGRGSSGKSIVVGVRSREGEVISKVVPDTSRKTLHGFIHENVKKGSTVYTDTWKSYKGLKGYNHETINHSHKEYVRGKIHTNGIENFWSIFKRGIIGIYHFVSHKHLQKYIDEFVFRYNTRTHTEGERFNLLLCNCGNRLTYKQLIS